VQYEKKALFTTFCDPNSILLLEFFDHRATANADNYCTTLRYMKEAMQRKLLAC
jgi:hypothetical protein